MSRRGALELLLRRYGEPVAYGGAQFRAVLRPLTAGGEDGRLLYAGPADRPLTEGGRLTAGARVFAVLRSDAVRLAGEGLYVRAVLAPLAGAENGEIRLERGGAVFARAGAAAAKAARDAQEEAPWGGEAEAVSAGAARWELTLTDVMPEDGADLFAPGAFRTVVEKNGEKIIYGGCRWAGAEASGSAAGARTLTLLAAERKKEAVQDG